MKKETFCVNGHDLHLLHGGEGEPLIYLHGYSDAGIWSDALELLSKSYHVYAPEHPGFGDSPRLNWVETVEDLTFYYLDFLDAQGIESAHIVGSSLGGWIAAEMALLHPGRVKSVTLIDAVGIRVIGNRMADIFMYDDAQLTSETFYNTDHAPKLSEEEQTKAKFNRRMLAQLGWQPRFYNPKLEGRLFRVKAPTLVVWGEQDRIAPLAIGEKYASLIPGAKLKVLPECGHMPVLEKQEALVEAIKEFTKKAQEV